VTVADGQRVRTREVATVAKHSTTAYDPRQIWSANLAPLVTAARQGAAHAARAASRERARARQEPPRWWRQRWLVMTAAAVTIAGAAGGVYAVLARRRSSTARHAETGVRPAPSNGATTNGIRSTMENGREKVTGLARSVVHRVRRDGPDQTAPAPSGGVAPSAAVPDGAAPSGTATGEPARPGMAHDDPMRPEPAPDDPMRSEPAPDGAVRSVGAPDGSTAPDRIPPGMTERVGALAATTPDDSRDHARLDGGGYHPL
jgi:hypothetical protein